MSPVPVSPAFIPLSLSPPLQAVSLSALPPVGHFQTWANLAFLGLFKPFLDTFFCWAWVCLGLVAFGALWGFSALLFFLPACRVNLHERKRDPLHKICTPFARFRPCPFVAFRCCVGVFVSLVFLGRFGGFSLLGWCYGLFLPLWALYGTKKARPCWVRLSLCGCGAYPIKKIASARPSRVVTLMASGLVWMPAALGLAI